MAFELDRLTDYSNDGILDEIRRVVTLLSVSTLTEAEFLRHARVSKNTIRRRFGGWQQATAAAGLTTLAPPARPRGKATNIGKSLNADEVVAELRRVAAAAETDSPTVAEFNALSTVGPGTVRGRFGSWQAALVAAGLQPNPRGRRYSDRECFENLLSVWTHHVRPPEYREMADPPSRITGKPYVTRWGSWNKALAAFVDYAKTDAPADLPAAATLTTPALPRSVQQGPRDVPLGLRYRVLVRDRFRCVICGASPASTLGCELHIDHVVPFSKGGQTVLENLRTLCSHCNLGKADRAEGAG